MITKRGSAAPALDKISLPITYAYWNIRPTQAHARRISLPWDWLAIPGYAAGQ